MPEASPIIVLFAGDLRLEDHPALHAASQAGVPVIPVYVLDEVDDPWAPGGASRWWQHHSLVSLANDLAALGSRLIFRRGSTLDVVRDLFASTGASAVFCTGSHEPAARERLDSLEQSGLPVKRFAGNWLHEPGSVLTGSGTPFKVFTPFYRACLPIPVDEPLPTPARLTAPVRWPDSDELASWALLPAPVDWAQGLRDSWVPGESGANQRLDEFLGAAVTDYKHARDVPGEPGTSRLSPHLHFGEISARTVWHQVSHHFSADTEGAASFLRELVWREFSLHLLATFPDMPERPLRPEFEHFPWQDNPEGLAAWQQGETGYPIVDAGMRELWHTGWMHNRVRMIAASFLLKNLRIDWHLGENWFWDTLVDADLANNSASWQWVTGCGTDSSPYYRIFNPVLQARRFDPKGSYIRKWIPELAQVPDEYLAEPWTMPALDRETVGVRLGQTYPHPMVDHGEARQAALDALQKMKQIAGLDG